MEILIIVGAIVVGAAVWTVAGFVGYRRMEAEDKRKIQSLLVAGHDMPSAISEALRDLKGQYNLNLSDKAISAIGERMQQLLYQMNTENVVEIYSTFVHRYIFRDRPRRQGVTLDQGKLLCAVEELQLRERNGYFVIKPDIRDEFDRKYPSKAT